MSSLNKFLVVLLIIQVVILSFRFQSPQPSLARGLFSLNEPVQTIEIDDRTNSVKIEKKGDQWVLPLKGDVPVDFARVEMLLQRLRFVSLDQPIIKNPASHSRLEISKDNYKRRIRFNEDEFGFYLGSSPSFQTIHLRLIDNDFVYLIEGLSDWDLSAERNRWVQAQVLNIGKDKLKTFKLVAQKENWSFKKFEKDWSFLGTSPQGSEFDSKTFTAWLDQQLVWSLSDVVNTQILEEHGFGQPTARLQFEVVGGTEEKMVPIDPEGNMVKKDTDEIKKLELIVGAKHPEKDEYFSRATDRDLVFTLPADRVENLLKAPESDFFRPIEKEVE